MNWRKKIIIFGIVTTMALLISSFNSMGFDATIGESEKTNLGTYNGQLRVYIAEPQSRWDNNDRDPYYFGFLDFAIDETLSIQYLDTYVKEITWVAQDAGYNNVKENNIIAIATVFNPEIDKGYSRPPTQNKFDAHYVDAAAGATPGETGHNEVTEDFTHTVFVEEATATWCPYCPAMAEALNGVYTSDDYPFYFVALIADKVESAYNYLVNDYNLYAYPSAYFDGGKRVLVGGYDDESYFRTRIEQCGSRDVHDLDLSISVEWVADGVLDISVTIVNNEQNENQPPDRPNIDGPVKIKAGVEQEYTISAVDPNGDDVYFWVLWFEGCPGVSWDGPYTSGEEVIYKYTYDQKGDYLIQVQAKDINGELSEWATLDISVPKTNRISLVLPFKLLDCFPILSEILRNIL